MKSKDFWWMVHIAILVLALSVGTLAQTSTPMNFSGLINDYTPSNISPAGPWEVRGEWSLMLRGVSGNARFSAALTMVRSDYWIVLNPANVDDPSTRSPHTHHLSLVDGVVTPITGGFRVTGSAALTASGSAPPFGSPVPVQIDIVGGSSLAFSNIKLTFLSPADGHFGTQPLEGVVLISK